MQHIYDIQHGIKRKYHRRMITLGLLLCISYFAFHAISGDRGFLALVNYTQLLQDTQTELDIANAEKLLLEHKVNSLRSESLDLDLLDEQARTQLGMSYRNERVYYIP